MESFSNNILPGFDEGKFVPVVDSVFSVDNIIFAHERMEKNLNKGKIIIKWE